MGPLHDEYDGEWGPHAREGWSAVEREAAVGALAERQHGIVSASQLLELGLTRSAIDARVRAKRLYVVHRGVYAVGHRGLTRRSRYLAAVFACGPEALLSHHSAAELWGLIRSSSRIEVTAPRGRKPRPGFRLHRSRVIHPADRGIADNIPVTSVARTIVDLTTELSERRLADLVNEAEIRRMFDLRAVQAALEQLQGRKGAKRLKRVLTTYSQDSHFTRTELERRFLRICATHQLPTPQVNLWIGSQEVDFYWPDARLAIETDGAAFHRTRRAFYEDRRRDRRLAAIGIQVNRVTWEDLEDEVGLAAELRRILAARREAAPAG